MPRDEEASTNDKSPLLEGSETAAPWLAALPEALFQKIAKRVIPVLWLAYILNIIDRTNLAYAQLQMSTDLSLSPRAFGLASGIFFIAYATMQVPANHCIPTVGATRVLPSSMVLWGVSATATAFVTTQHQLLALRFILGLSESAFFPGVLLYLTRWFPEANSGRALAYFSTAASIGGLLSSAGSGLLLSVLDGARGVRGWRWLLFIEGLPTIALGLLAPLLLDEFPRHARWLNAEEKETLVHALEGTRRRKSRETGPDDPATTAGPLPAASPEPSAADASSIGGETSLGSDPAGPDPAAAAVASSSSPPTLGKAMRSTLFGTPCILFCLQYVVCSSIANSARFFLPTLLKEVYPSMPPWRLGMIFAAPAALKVVLSPPVGAWADAGGPPRRFCSAWGLYASAGGLLFLAGSGMLLLGGRGNTAAASFLVALVATADVLAQLAIPVFWSLHNNHQPPGLRGISIAIVNSVGNLGGFVGPFVLGAMHDSAVAARACAADHGADTGGFALHTRGTGGGPPPQAAGCTAQWGLGTLMLGGAAMVATALSAHGLKSRLGSDRRVDSHGKLEGGDVGPAFWQAKRLS